MIGKFRGTTTYPGRSAVVFKHLGKLVENKRLHKNERLHVVLIGTGLALRMLRNKLPPGGKPREGSVIKDVTIKYLDRIGRTFPTSGRGLVTYQPFELAQQLENSMGKGANFRITILDKHKEVAEALPNDPRYKQFKDRIRFVQRDIEKDSPPPADIIVAQKILPHVKRQIALENINRNLKPGGFLVSEKLSAEEIQQLDLLTVKDFEKGSIYVKG